MATMNKSTNYKFNLPTYSDSADIMDIYDNWEKADGLFADAWYKTANVIDANKDLNSFCDIGIYIYSAGTAATLSNVPEVSQGTMIVLPRLTNGDTSNITQMIVTRENSIYVRAKYDDTWKDWSKFATKTELENAIANHGRHIPNNCATTEDWNTAVTNGWYMSQGEGKNAPTASWVFGQVIAHNENYVLQEVYDFTKSSAKATDLTRYIRSRYNGTWTDWINVTVQRTVPENTKLEYITTLKSDAQTQINDLTNNKMNTKPNFIEFATNSSTGNGGYLDFHFNGSTEDWTSRIIEEKEGQIGVIADILRLTGILQIADGDAGLYGDDHTVNVVTKSDTTKDYKRAIQIMNKAYESDIAKSLILINKDSSGSTNYLIHGDHNKPSGSYTGNGSARTINIGGSGNLIAIWGIGSYTSGSTISYFPTLSFVTNNYIFYMDQSESLAVNGGIKFTNGTLSIGSGHTSIANAEGRTYYYQVL